MDSVEGTGSAQVPRIFVVCDRSDTAPVWGYILRQQGLIVILESSVPKAFERWSSEAADLVVLDVDVARHDPVEMCKKFRAASGVPMLLFLPTHHETQVLEAYAAGVDEVIVKPVSPAIFQAKIMAWMRRTWSLPVGGLGLVKAGEYRLEPAQRTLVEPGGVQVKLTNLEFRLMHVLMGCPGQLFSADELVQAIWGAYGNGDQVLLKNVVYRLRRKVELDPSRPQILRTWQGGYYFQG